MNLARIRNDISAAQQYFDFVEGWSTASGGLMAVVALQTSTRFYTLEVTFPESYPNSMPKVHVRKPSVSSNVHMFSNNQICYLHPHMWNPGRHDLTFVISRASKWLAKYEIYKRTSKWPGAGLDH